MARPGPAGASPPGAEEFVRALRAEFGATGGRGGGAPGRPERASALRDVAAARARREARGGAGGGRAEGGADETPAGPPAPAPAPAPPAGDGHPSGILNWDFPVTPASEVVALLGPGLSPSRQRREADDAAFARAVLHGQLGRPFAEAEWAEQAEADSQRRSGLQLAASLFRSHTARAREAREEAALRERVRGLEGELGAERARRAAAEAEAAAAAERAGRELDELRAAALGDKGRLRAQAWALWARLLEARRAAAGAGRLSEALGREEARARGLEAELARRGADLRAQKARAAEAAGEARALQHALAGALAELKALRADFLGLTLRPALAAGVQCDLGRDRAASGEPGAGRGRGPAPG